MHRAQSGSFRVRIEARHGWMTQRICETRNGSQPAAARNLIPLSRFPQGESRGGAVPPTPRHVPCQPTSPARPLQRLPPQEGSAPLRIPHLSAAPETKKTKDGRHVGLDFYDLLIEPLMRVIRHLLRTKHPCILVCRSSARLAFSAAPQESSERDTRRLYSRRDVLPRVRFRSLTVAE